MELPDRLESFKKREPSTAIIEQQARQLVVKQFQFPELREFIKAVCKWGGYEGVAGRVLKNNSKQQLRESFRSAHSHAASDNDREAINSLLDLNGLAVSFASKHLKFLAPEKAVVLDSIISERLGYP